MAKRLVLTRGKSPRLSAVNFNNWEEVEKRIYAKDDIICVADYVFPEGQKDNKAYQIFQLTFVPAGIYRTGIITDDVIINMYQSIYTMFQQACLSIDTINRGGKITVLSKPIVFNGIDFEDKTSMQVFIRESGLYPYNICDIFNGVSFTNKLILLWVIFTYPFTKPKKFVSFTVSEKGLYISVLGKFCTRILPRKLLFWVK